MRSRLQRKWSKIGSGRKINLRLTSPWWGRRSWGGAEGRWHLHFSSADVPGSPCSVEPARTAWQTCRRWTSCKSRHCSGFWCVSLRRCACKINSHHQTSQTSSSFDNGTGQINSKVQTPFSVQSALRSIGSPFTKLYLWLVYQKRKLNMHSSKSLSHVILNTIDGSII